MQHDADYWLRRAARERALAITATGFGRQLHLDSATAFDRRAARASELSAERTHLRLATFD